jgi:hypothetical protein
MQQDLMGWHRADTPMRELLPAAVVVALRESLANLQVFRFFIDSSRSRAKVSYER